MRRTGSYCDGHAHAGRSRNAALLLLGLPLVLLLAACGSDQSTLQPASKASSDIATVWWVMLVGSAVVFAVVLALVVVVVVRRRGAATPADGPGGRNRGAHIFVGLAGVLVPLVVLAALFALTLGTVSTTSSAAGASSSVMTIQVTGRQWFWDVEYPDHHVRTANEIHIPVDETVTIVALSGDVIHSFWVPELNRKIDMIPGQRNVIRLRADRAGVFRGQCAEFCGLQHAHMAFTVVAEPRDTLDAWLARESQPAPQPQTVAEQRGQQVLLGSSCVYCHTIDGTNASGQIGPDLTHLASRRSIGAGVVPNTPGYLAGWILDPQHLKPGNKMPATALSGPELQDLLAYLRTLR
ncbi:MAG: cytochrome c oxidase subunit II [Gaiella sp.]|uniref:cytochrome c oxidase subunit II n=1 Tax=Gaiella sp. TaxID=2663207 RepID=UPI003C7614B3